MIDNAIRGWGGPRVLGLGLGMKRFPIAEKMII